MQQQNAANDTNVLNPLMTKPRSQDILRAQKENTYKKCMLIIINMHMNNIKYQMNCTPKIEFNFWGAVFLCQNILKNLNDLLKPVFK